MAEDSTVMAHELSSFKPAQLAPAVLAFADGRVFHGLGVGSEGVAIGELCFNTSMVGYQEILTDPSYTDQILVFTFPHIGNVGANEADMESSRAAACGFVLREVPTWPSNFRAQETFDAWAARLGLIGIAGLDTRLITVILRDRGALAASIAHGASWCCDANALVEKARAWPGIEGKDLASTCGVDDITSWHEGCRYQPSISERIDLDKVNHRPYREPVYHVVVVDYGVKHSTLRCLVDRGCRVTQLPATATIQDVLACQPDGVLLANGPGDPSATAELVLPTIKELLNSHIPILGICLGHQILALALGASTIKMHHGHHGANHPVRDEITGRVKITSQNHGFVVAPENLPDNVVITERSLFDGSIAGLALKDRPLISVQYHPEAGPGPRDARTLFEHFIALMAERCDRTDS